MGMNNKATLHVGKMNKLNCGNYLPRYAENSQKQEQDKDAKDDVKAKAKSK